MDKLTPAIPYEIDFDLFLFIYTFDKDQHQISDVERVISTFINRLIAKPSSPSRRKEIVLWRGEYKNWLGMEMYVIGLPVDYDDATLHELFEAAKDTRDDFGEYQRIDTGCQPYLLIFHDQLWMFDATKAPQSEGTLVLAETAFPVRYLPCIHSASNGEWVSNLSMMGEELINIKLSICLEKWKAIMSDSADQNWPLVRERLSDLLLYVVHVKEYGLLREICSDIIHIPVFDIPMQEYGRTIVGPILSEDDDAFFVSDYSVAIAIKEDLSEKQKLLSLAHELGHYVNHYTFLKFFSQLFLFVRSDPFIEFSVADQLDEAWQELYYRITECRADLFASYFLIPYEVDEAIEEVERMSHRVTPYTTDAQRLHFIRNFFETEKQVVGFNQVEHLIAGANSERFEAITQAYLPEKTLFERMIWCIFQRRTPFFLETLKGGEKKLQEKWQAVLQSVYNGKPDRKAIPSRSRRPFIKRSTLQNLKEDFLSGKEQWEPIIIEPTELHEIDGYLCLIPGLNMKSNTASMDWTLYEMAFKGPQGPLEIWIKLAKSIQKGVMIFPFNPLDIYLRQDL